MSLVVAAAVVLRGRRLLVVSKHAAPDVFYLPGGKLEPGESPEEAMRREVREELGVTVRDAAHFLDVRAPAAIERVPMRLTVFRVAIEGEPAINAELAALDWVADATAPGLGPAIRDHVIPALVAARLLDAAALPVD
ncbi:NUDIX domain-containing protein [Nocardioides sp. L-11A]|uniref:NUDIX hydrolase n=1 Tax=Nocardioides sp. L-11A TaxID=3043848 RepID=UPI002499D3DC|nr:NUDIX domain-containing protein [Nocardioides sp. L-11A]